MNIGTITADTEARVNVRIRGTGGVEVAVLAILDTGFSEYLTLPLGLIEELSLSLQEATRIRLADGSLRIVDVYQGHVWWDENWRSVLIQASEGDPLLGMALLRNYLLTLEIVTGGAVTLETLE